MASEIDMAGEAGENSDLAFAINHVGINLYKQLSQKEGNIFFSPLSLSCALAMAFHGAQNETAEEMRAALGYEASQIEDTDVRLKFSKLLLSLNETPELYTFAIANVVFGQRDFPIKREFKNTLEEFFTAKVLEADFVNESQKAVQEVNQWVNGKTNGMIQHLLDELEPNTVMVLLNAVYFKGLWLNQFKEKSTFMSYFYNKGIEDNAKLVDTMHLKESFAFLENDTFKAIELPYKGNEVGMLILLPNARDGLEELESQVSANFIDSVKQQMQKVKVQVALPKFRLEYSKSLKEDFQSLGLKKPFHETADFGGISDTGPIFISEIMHKAVLEVNEEGSEAAAATAVVMQLRCITFCPEFVVDHPFLFFIHNIKDNIILFMGKVDEL